MNGFWFSASSAFFASALFAQVEMRWGEPFGLPPVDGRPSGR